MTKFRKRFSKVLIVTRESGLPWKTTQLPKSDFVQKLVMDDRRANVTTNGRALRTTEPCFAAPAFLSRSTFGYFPERVS